MKQKRFSKEIDIDLDEGQGTIHAVRFITDSYLLLLYLLIVPWQIVNEFLG